MAGGKATLLLTDIIIPRGELIHDNFFPEYKNDGIKQKLAVTGNLYMLCSIPSSSLYTVIKKGDILSFKNEIVPGIYKSSLVKSSIISLNLKFSL